MSETTNAKKNYFKITKTTTDDVVFLLSPINNSGMSKTIHLTRRTPSMTLPLDWALGVFLDDALFNMYRNGYFTFDDNDALVIAAEDAGVYFGELDFTPVTEDHTEKIFGILQAGNRQDILAAIKEFGTNKVKEVAIARVNFLTTNVVLMLESIFGIQLTMDER